MSAPASKGKHSSKKVWTYYHNLNTTVRAGVTYIGGGWFWFEPRESKRFFLFSTPAQTGSGAHLAYCTIGTVSLFRGYSGQGVTLITNPQLVPNVRMTTATPLLYVRAWTALWWGYLHLISYFWRSLSEQSSSFLANFTPWLLIQSFMCFIRPVLIWKNSSVPAYAVAQLVEALRYKREGRGFNSRWCHRNFSST
jgi:hypothetical protein